VYRWELDGLAEQEFATLPLSVQVTLTEFLDAVVIVDPAQYQRRRDERDDVDMPLRTLHFGQHDQRAGHISGVSARRSRACRQDPVAR
jgi:membrane-anchored protein YejM (alkaline phosphatase superfamily)